MQQQKEKYGCLHNTVKALQTGANKCWDNYTNLMENLNEKIKNDYETWNVKDIIQWMQALIDVKTAKTNLYSNFCYVFCFFCMCFVLCVQCCFWWRHFVVFDSIYMCVYVFCVFFLCVFDWGVMVFRGAGEKLHCVLCFLYICA